VAARWVLGGLACLVAAVGIAQELPRLLETVEVRVVNVDVVVSDADGRPVRGLERGDFELLVNGRPVEVEYFNSVVDGLEAGSEAEEASSAALPYLAIVFDGRSMRPARARRAIEKLSDRLGDLLESTRAIMVIRQGTSLVVEQPMTRDRLQLFDALDRLVAHRMPALDVGDRQLLLRQLEGSGAPRVLRATESDLETRPEDQVAVQQAHQLLRQIRIQAGMERHAAEESSRQLRLLARSMAGLPGRKAILLLGKGIERQPAEALFRLWWNKFGSFASRIGVVSIDAEMSQERGDHLIDQLIDEANASRVTFFSHDPAGPSGAGGSAEFNSSETGQEIARGLDRMRDSLVDLSLATGGVGRVPSGVGSLLDEMQNGFGTYYSLGFTPDEIERGRVRVRVRQPDLRVRYLRQFAARTAAQELEEATLATLLTGAEDNRLQVAVDLGKAEPQKDGTFLVSVLIKVPMARVSLLPQRAHHVGRLSFVVMAQTADGALSRPATGEVPIEIANAELLSVMGQIAGYRMKLQTSAGEQILAIGVRDEVAHEDATLRLVLTAGWGA
jgi:VWFA-related protein